MIYLDISITFVRKIESEVFDYMQNTNNLCIEILIFLFPSSFYLMLLSLHNRVTTIFEVLEILKDPSRFRIFKKKIYGKLVSDFL